MEYNTKDCTNLTTIVKKKSSFVNHCEFNYTTKSGNNLKNNQNIVTIFLHTSWSTHVI